MPERINLIRGSVREFIAAWQDPHAPLNSRPAPFRESQQGNLNATGDAADYFAPVLTRHHPRFLDALEGGVRDLVLELIERLGCITYSSCQGHPSLGPEVPMRERSVEVIAERPVELEKILIKVLNLASLTNKQIDTEIIKVLVSCTPLRSLDTCTLCVRLRFKNVLSQEMKYFQNIDSAYCTLIGILKSHF